MCNVSDNVYVCAFVFGKANIMVCKCSWKTICPFLKMLVTESTLCELVTKYIPIYALNPNNVSQMRGHFEGNQTYHYI